MQDNINASYRAFSIAAFIQLQSADILKQLI